MRVIVKIPKGWRRVRPGERGRISDKVLYTRDWEPMEWNFVSPNFIVIRRKQK